MNSGSFYLSLSVKLLKHIVFLFINLNPILNLAIFSFGFGHIAAGHLTPDCLGPQKTQPPLQHLHLQVKEQSNSRLNFLNYQTQTYSSFL